MKTKILFILSFLLCLFTPLQAEEEIPLDEIDEAGTYFIDVYAYDLNGFPYSKTIRVTVLYPTSVLNREKQEGIDAQDFKVLSGAMKTLNDASLIQLSNAHAWSLETGEEVPITTIKNTQIKKSEYKIYFSTDNNTNTTVRAIEFDEIYMNLKNSVINPSFLWYQQVNFFSIFIILLLIFSLLIIFFSVQRSIKEYEQTVALLFNKKNKS